MKRVFLIVLDSFGIGEMEDAASYGDYNVNTIRSVSSSSFFNMPNMGKLGLFEIDGVTLDEQHCRGNCCPEALTEHTGKTAGAMQGVVARMKETSAGKDTTIGHWEIAGIHSPKPLPTYPEGFPQSIIDAFCEKTGRGVLCNLPYSGTKVIADYGAEHVRSGDLIVYTSADSVFQIAAHEEIVPVEQLYEYCRIARELLQGEHGVGRVIARPFIGENGNYTRTSRRHDFSITPPATTMLDQLKEHGKAVIAVGKITDIFAGRGITESVYTGGNTEGIARTLEYMDKDFEGLCFINLVDYDMLYGHRRDIDGYANALSEFDAWLEGFLDQLGEDDLVMITADHGCDPGYAATTDHTREYVSLLVLGKNIKPCDLGTRKTFADVAATVAELLGVSLATPGTSFAQEILK